MNEIRFCPKCKSENVRPSASIKVIFTGQAVSWKCLNCGYENDIFPIKVKEKSKKKTNS